MIGTDNESGCPRCRGLLSGRLVLGLAATLVSIAPVAVGHAQSAAGRRPVPGAPAGVTAFVNVAVLPMDSERVLAH
jgi:hypothetical protein